jgi:hypothetical protein
MVMEELDSTSKNIIDDKYIVRYKIGEWVSPNVPNTPLYVFDDVDAIKWWFNLTIDKSIRLFVCEVENPKKSPMLSFIHNNDVDAFWNNKDKQPLMSEKYMDGVVGCSRVMLVEEIKKERYREMISNDR